MKLSLGYGRVLSSALWIFPLFWVYQVMLLYTGSQNGVDVLSGPLFSALAQNPQQYVLVHILLLAAYLALLGILYTQKRLSLRSFVPLVLESGAYALTLGSFIVFVMDRLLGIEALSLGTGPLLVLSLGAGVHEELVFRFVLMGALGLFLQRALPASLAIFLAALLSSALFAWAHHLGSNGDPVTLSLLLYRFLAGLMFSAIFYYRSFAHAVYTHTLYDLYVLGLA